MIDGNICSWKIAKAAESRLSAHLSIYLSTYVQEEYLSVCSLCIQLSHRDSYSLKASKRSTLLPQVPMQVEMRLKYLSGGRGERTGWASPTSANTSVGINLCSWKIAMAAAGRLSAHPFSDLKESRRGTVTYIAGGDRADWGSSTPPNTSVLSKFFAARK